MKKIVFFMLIILAMAAGPSFAHAAGGAVLQTLYQNICSSKSPYALKTGCKGYFQLRIIHDGKQAQALNWCSNGNNGCRRFFEGTDLQKCKEGCQYANSQEK